MASKLGVEFGPSKTYERRSPESGEPRPTEPTLLAGEDPTTVDPEDVEHWVEVYTELFDFSSELLPTTPEGSEGMEGQVCRMAGRLEFWRRRREALASDPPGQSHDWQEWSRVRQGDGVLAIPCPIKVQRI